MAWKQDDWRKNLSVEIQALERQLAAEVEGRRRRAV